MPSLHEANQGKDSLIPVHSNWDSFQCTDGVELACNRLSYPRYTVSQLEGSKAKRATIVILIALSDAFFETSYIGLTSRRRVGPEQSRTSSKISQHLIPVRRTEREPNAGRPAKHLMAARWRNSGRQLEDQPPQQEERTDGRPVRRTNMRHHAEARRQWRRSQPPRS